MPTAEPPDIGPKRSKRSTTNLANLRLAPLSTKFASPSDKSPPLTRRSHEEQRDFARYHSSYLQDRSAPTTPGILSRSSSRRHLSGNRSRRGSLYDNEGVTFDYAAAATTSGQVGRPSELASGRVPKAKSEAALHLRQMTPRNGTSPIAERRSQHSYHVTASGTVTPRAKSRTKLTDTDWLTRTGAATNAVLQETKGQMWLTARETAISTTTSALHSTDDEDEDDDDGYEEMAAMSALTIRPPIRPGTTSPMSTRNGAWGSRYGSRTASRRTSRRGSTTGARTPAASALQAGPESAMGYFEDRNLSRSTTAVADDEASEPDDSANERELARLASEGTTGYGLSSFVDRIISSSLFNVNEEAGESSSNDDYHAETEAEARVRRAAEIRRKREEKERLVAPPDPIDEVDATEQADVGWRDAAWLLSVASRALFSDGA